MFHVTCYDDPLATQILYQGSICAISAIKQHHRLPGGLGFAGGGMADQKGGDTDNPNPYQLRVPCPLAG